jgi:hypothetical protein
MLAFFQESDGIKALEGFVDWRHQYLPAGCGRWDLYEAAGMFHTENEAEYLNIRDLAYKYGCCDVFGMPLFTLFTLCWARMTIFLHTLSEMSLSKENHRGVVQLIAR